MSKIIGTPSLKHSVTITNCAPKLLYSSMVPSVVQSIPHLPLLIIFVSWIKMEEFHHRARWISYLRWIPRCHFRMFSCWYHLPFHTCLQQWHMHCLLSSTTMWKSPNLYTIQVGYFHTICYYCGSHNHFKPQSMSRCFQKFVPNWHLQAHSRTCDEEKTFHTSHQHQQLVEFQRHV